MAGLPTDPNDIETITSGKFTGYAYITTKGYNNEDVNWAIIGCSDKPSTISTGKLNLADVVSKYYNYSGYDANSIWQFFATGSSTFAGSVIWNEYSTGKDEIYNTLSGTISQKAVFPNAVPSSELEFNEVLCFAQGLVKYSSGANTAVFGSSNIYSRSNLRTVMNTYRTDYLQSIPIVPQPLTTIYAPEKWGNAKDADATNEYLFPLAVKGSVTINSETVTENFVYSTYLTAGSSDIKMDSRWWLRSSGGTSSTSAVYFVDPYGTVTIANYSNVSTNSNGVRPAFVLKL